MTDSLAEHRAAIRRATRADEKSLVAELLGASELDRVRRRRILDEARGLVETCRAKSHKAGTLDAFLQEFGLSNREGIALMCLAEALLRVPDEETADRLIAEKIRGGDWESHLGASRSAFVNASVWALMLTGGIVRLESDITGDTASWMRRLVGALGEPVVRRAVLQAMRIMGGQYVLGRTIGEGLKKGVAGNRPETRFSFDMLGEGARTMPDAERYFGDYESAIRAVAETVAPGQAVECANGVSVKLSALHPRYEFRQRRRVLSELLPRLRELALLSARAGMGLSIDAEECDRLDLSLDLFEALAGDEALAGWNGLGFVLQAYQKRALATADWLIALARDTGRRLMVRLVKGAYWDGEIKRAQEQGLADYPVWTRKCHSDLGYQLCAERLLAARDAIYPQFATHNAHSVALVRELAGGADFELQRLHGMGALLYEELQAGHPDIPVRVYAPIGRHRDLLPYLVRRLLENGANSSFVNRFLDAEVPVAELLRDPMELAAEQALGRHPRIPRPRDIYLSESRPWLSARGIDLNDPLQVAPLLETIARAGKETHHAAPIVGGRRLSGAARDLIGPADGTRLVGRVVEADAAAIEAALAGASAAQPGWDAAGAQDRAACLERTADLLERHCESLMGLIVAEAGRTVEDALSEVREAVDFCRYYARQARAHFATRTLPGPTGELNELSLHGRGVFLCISPWNFPLAIFTGQIAAALAAGNSVIAKPAEQTPLVAARAVRLLHEAGVPGEVLHLLPGDGARVGGALVRDARIQGVAFTGGLETARLINLELARRDGAIAALIAETGGLNAMIVDATALPEQVVDDVIASAFLSAGQRCSALRVLYLQEDIADGMIDMLAGAMRELVIGDPAELSTDIGPVIDREAREKLERHDRRMAREAKLLAARELKDAPAGGCFFAPRVYELRHLSQLPEEVFGPCLHVIRYRSADLSAVLADIGASGYGLTLGVHSRIDEFAREIFETAGAGNTYINRNMVGAVVGVQPFGGRGLSGTGPKAGGPHYLPRFATERTRTDNLAARGGDTRLFTLRDD